MNLKGLRTNKGLSQDTLASKLNTNRTTISKIEKNNKIPTVDLLLAYSKEFEIPTDALLGKMDKYYGYIQQESYFKSISYQEMINAIFDDFIGRIKQTERLEDKFFVNQENGWKSINIEKGIYNLSILEDIKKKAQQEGVTFSNYEENILISVLNELLIERDNEKITNIYLFLNNIDKFEDITKEIVKQNESRLKLIVNILREFK